ncbi:hypothetical protein [Dolichospermum sp. UHCC 0259]|nr:hypothetical protein [Dolichospermum sp. UHCC 0259]
MVKTSNYTRYTSLGKDPIVPDHVGNPVHEYKNRINLRNLPILSQDK